MGKKHKSRATTPSQTLPPPIPLPNGTFVNFELVDGEVQAVDLDKKLTQVTKDIKPVHKRKKPKGVFGKIGRGIEDAAKDTVKLGKKIGNSKEFKDTIKFAGGAVKSVGKEVKTDLGAVLGGAKDLVTDVVDSAGEAIDNILDPTMLLIIGAGLVAVLLISKQ